MDQKSIDLKEQSSTTAEAQVADSNLAFTAEEEKAIVRKIDCVVLPIMCAVFFLQYMDKQSLAYASVFGLITDLELSSSQYSWSSSIFYFGQLVAEYPFIYLMGRLPLTKFVGVTIVIWGCVCMCLAAPSNFAGFATVRFFLGVSEGAVSPAFVTFTSIWYRKHEHALRVGTWVTMNSLAQSIGALLMYGIGKNTALTIAPWRVLFLVCGALTVAAGFGFYFAMPPNPDKAWFFSEREREIVRHRMIMEKDGGDYARFSVAQAKEALTDIRSILVFVFGILITMQSPVLTFASLIIKNLQFDAYQTMLYSAPSGAVQVVILWIGMGLCYLLPRNRIVVIFILAIPPLVGNVLLLKLPISNGWGIIVASWLSSCLGDIMAVILSLSASNIKGNTKRSVVNTYFFIGYCVGCIAGPQLWQANTAPHFTQGVITSIVTTVLLLLFMLLYWYLCARENKRRDSLPEEEHLSASHVGLDYTDKEDLRFRYSV